MRKSTLEQSENMSQIKQVQLRRASLADAEAIAAVRVEAWRESYREIVPAAYLAEMSIDESRVQWQRILEAMQDNLDKICVYVAESEGHIVGFASANLLEHEKFGMQAELSSVYLRPAWQRSGIGRRLLDKLARTVQQMGARSMLVWVFAENRIGRNFYEELSGEFLHEQEFSWDGLDLREVAYGWSDLNVLRAATQAHGASEAVH